MTTAQLDPDDLTLTKEPQQARSRRTLERLREAAWDLLEQEGIEALTVTALSSAAGVSVGSFYARFEGKEELLDHLEAVALEASLRSWSEAVDAAQRELLGGGTRRPEAVSTRMEDLLAHLLHLYRRGPARRLLLLSRGDGRSAARMNRLHQEVAEALARVLSAQGTEVPGQDPILLPRPGSFELLRGAALAAAARELALAVDGPAQSWLLGGPPEPGVDRRLLRAVLLLGGPTALGADDVTGPSGDGPGEVRPEDVTPEEEGAGEDSPDEAAAEKPTADEESPADEEPEGDRPEEERPDDEPPGPGVELFDVWG